MSASGTTIKALLSPGSHANSSASGWGFGPLPPNITFVNGTMNGTIISGRLYNGSDSSIMTNDTIIIHTLNSNTIGSVSLSSFIYIIMSCIIIIAMLPNGLLLIRAASNHNRVHNSATHPTYTERMFQKDLQRCYPATPLTRPQPSYPELVDKMINGRISHKDIEWCKTLLRGKYALDCQTLGLRHVYKSNRRIVDGMEARSAGAVQELHGIANTWMSAKDQWSAEEWELVKQICRRIFAIEDRGRQ
jgi:hypothetical protein